MCDGKGCVVSCHLKCAGLVVEPAMEDTWYCQSCSIGNDKTGDVDSNEMRIQEDMPKKRPRGRHRKIVVQENLT